MGVNLQHSLVQKTSYSFKSQHQTIIGVFQCIIWLIDKLQHYVYYSTFEMEVYVWIFLPFTIKEYISTEFPKHFRILINVHVHAIPHYDTILLLFTLACVEQWLISAATPCVWTMSYRDKCVTLGFSFNSRDIGCPIPPLAPKTATLEFAWKSWIK